MCSTNFLANSPLRDAAFCYFSAIYSLIPVPFHPFSPSMDTAIFPRTLVVLPINRLAPTCRLSGSCKDGDEQQDHVGNNVGDENVDIRPCSNGTIFRNEEVDIRQLSSSLSHVLHRHPRSLEENRFLCGARGVTCGISEHIEALQTVSRVSLRFLYVICR